MRTGSLLTVYSVIGCGIGLMAAFLWMNPTQPLLAIGFLIGLVYSLVLQIIGERLS